MLVLHYTGMVDGPTAIARLLDPASEVSAHYVVNEDGTVMRLVPEERRAWHAGRSRWQGEDDLNSRSVGIEIVNGGHEFGLPPYPDAQSGAVIMLAREIVERWAIPPSRIVGHSDIAPDRKEDPGERFPWSRLAAAGVGVWPSQIEIDAALAAARPTNSDPRQDLRAIGYAIAEDDEGGAGCAAAVRAFQRRWRPEAITGHADEDTRARILAVRRLLGR
jgi:N-acetylmuramoyl-L-alanine amidase